MNYSMMKGNVIAQIIDYINGNYPPDDDSDERRHSYFGVVPAIGMAKYKGTKAGKAKWLADKIEAGRAAQAEALRNFKHFSKPYGEDATPDEVIDAVNTQRLLERGIKEEDCYKNWRLEQFLCRAAYSWPDYDTCLKRAEDNRDLCKRYGHYNGLGILTREESSGKPQATLDDLRPTGEGQPETGPQAGSGSEDKPSEFSANNVLANAAILGATPLYGSQLLHFYLSQPETQQRVSEGFQSFLKGITLPQDVYSHGMGPNPGAYGPPAWLAAALAGGL